MSARSWVVASMCALLLSLPVASKAAKSKVPPGSFLTRPVSSASELAKLVREDKVTALRYSKHFGMDPAALALYFQDHLSVSTLKSSKRFPTMYFIAENGRIVTRKKTLKAGTKIFVGHDGQPVMDIACGNPFAKSLPKVAKAVPPVFPKPLVLPPEPVVPAVTEPPPPTVESPSVAEVLSEPLEPVEVEVLATPALEFPPAAIWLIPSLIGVGALAGGGGNGPIPEPTSIFVLGTGVVGLLFKFGRSVKSSRGRSKMKSTCSYIAIVLLIGGLLAAAPAHAVPWSAAQTSGITYVDSVLSPTPGGDIWTYTWELTNQSPVTIDLEDITVLVWSLQPFNVPEPIPDGATAPAGWEWNDSSKMWQMYEIADPSDKYYTPPAVAPTQTVTFTYVFDRTTPNINPFGDDYPGDPVNDIGFIAHVGAVEPVPMNPGDPILQWIPSTTQGFGDTWYDIPAGYYVVPEPSSVLALAMAGATLLGGIIRRRRDS